jgi:hypothetical protein
MEKKCCHCKKVKPVAEFRARAHKWDSRCHLCRSEYERERRAKIKEKRQKEPVVELARAPYFLPWKKLHDIWPLVKVRDAHPT